MYSHAFLDQTSLFVRLSRYAPWVAADTAHALNKEGETMKRNNVLIKRVTFYYAICFSLGFKAALYAQDPGNYFQWVTPPPDIAFVGDQFIVSAKVNCTAWWDTSLSRYASYIRHPLFSSVDVAGATWQKKMTATSAGSDFFEIIGICAGTAHHSITCNGGAYTVYALSEKLASVAIDGPTNVLSHVSTQLTFTATSAASTSWTGQDASWYVSPASSATISSSGVLTVKPTSVAKTISVSLSYDYRTITKTATKTLTITPNTTVTTPVRIPYGWLDNYPLLLSSNGGNYEVTANSSVANGYKVWESYVAGLVPTNSESKFITFIGFSNGSPVLTWTPNLSSQRVYTVEGAANLSSSPWGPTNAESRFFRVKVRMP